MAIAAPTAVSGLYSGGPADPGTPNVTTDATGKPTSLGYYGHPGTAVITQFASGSGWILGRYGNGTFITGGSSGTLTFGPNDAVHFAVQSPTTSLPTSGTAQYVVAGSTEPTFPGGARSFDDPVVIFNLGVQFGSAPKFGFDGTISGAVNGATPASFSFSTAGGSAAPSLTNTYVDTGNLSLFGTAPVTAVTSNLCASASACKVNANFISGGAGASTFAVGYGLVGVGDNKSILNGAAILSKGTAATTTTPTTTTSGQAPTGAGTYTAQGPGFNRSAITATIVATTSGQLTSATATSGTYARGTATDTDNGGSGGIVGWSRWVSGTATVAGTSVPLSATQGIHNVWGAPLTNMPTAGTASYDLVGATKPTIGDGSQAPGTFTGSLAVAFATAKVGWESNIALGGTNYAFNSSGGLANPSVTLGSDGRWVGSSVAVGTQQGRAYGFLAGDAASHAGMSYFLQTNTATGTDATTITGVAAFAKR